MAIISIGKVDKNIIPIIIACAFAFLFKLLTIIKTTILFDHTIIINFYIAISKLFSIVPFIILKIRTKKVKERKKPI